jgi:hypothetical protein
VAAVAEVETQQPLLADVVAVAECKTALVQQVEEEEALAELAQMLLFFLALAE